MSDTRVYRFTRELARVPESWEDAPRNAIATAAAGGRPLGLPKSTGRRDIQEGT